MRRVILTVLAAATAGAALLSVSFSAVGYHALSQPGSVAHHATLTAAVHPVSSSVRVYSTD
jgi:hypothetical protein